MDKSIDQMQQDLTAAGYSISTRKHYLATVRALWAHFGRPVAELGRDEMRTYLEHLRGLGRSASWLKIAYSALAFLFRKTLGRPNDVSFVCWPARRKIKPDRVARKRGRVGKSSRIALRGSVAQQTEVVVPRAS
jgi:Phage integrase, N-terminal SAM-like domain